MGGEKYEPKKKKKLCITKEERWESEPNVTGLYKK